MAGCCAHFCFWFSLVTCIVNAFYTFIAWDKKDLLGIRANEEHGIAYQDNAKWSMFTATLFYFALAVLCGFLKDREPKKRNNMNDNRDGVEMTDNRNEGQGQSQL